MEQLTCDRLQENLQRLKLVRAAEVLEAVVARAEEDKASYLSFLDHLLEEEVAAKEKRRIMTALKIAGLPFAKTIEEYDFLFHPHLDKKAVMDRICIVIVDPVGEVRPDNRSAASAAGCSRPSGPLSGAPGRT